jgi:AAA15 family ATPase/GTPase
MRITRLEVRNFKAVRNLTLSDLGDVILIAGPNSCGKSCVLDAIRLLKSVYAGYRQSNEWLSFFGEFQINLNNAIEIRRLFTETDQPILISAEF